MINKYIATIASMISLAALLTFYGCARPIITEGELIGTWTETSEIFKAYNSNQPRSGAPRPGNSIQFNGDHTFKIMPFYWEGTWKLADKNIECSPKEYYQPLELMNLHRDKKDLNPHKFAIGIMNEGKELHIDFHSRNPKDLVTLVYSKASK